jgi:hypothetical protein
VLDEADRVLASDDREVSSGPDGLVYGMALGAALESGHRYTILLDAQGPGSIVDASGRIWAETRFGVQVAGMREKPSPTTRKRHHRRS